MGCENYHELTLYWVSIIDVPLSSHKSILKPLLSSPEAGRKAAISSEILLLPSQGQILTLHGKASVMNTRWNARIIGLLLASVLWGGGAPALVGAQDVAAPQSRHILWKVQSSSHTMYLLGSIHVLQKKHYPLDRRLYEAFNQASTVIFEVDLDGLASPLSQLQILTKGLYRKGQTLQSELPIGKYEAAKAHFAELGFNIENFHRMKPWMAATAITALELQKLGYESAFGVDRHFFEKAKEAGKDIQGLESVEFQLGMFDHLTPSIQEAFLLQSLEDLKDIEARINGMVDAWTQGNVQDLERILEGMREYPELYHALVISRNQNWLPHIEQTLHKNNSVLVVIGALHLLGEEGILAALKKKGYQVEQM